MNLIQVEIFHKQDEDKDHPAPQRVKIIYPLDSGHYKSEEVLLPRNGHLGIEYGLYGRSGFFNNTLHIIGEMGSMRVEKKLPLSACNITDYYNL